MKRMRNGGCLTGFVRCLIPQEGVSHEELIRGHRSYLSKGYTSVCHHARQTARQMGLFFFHAQMALRCLVWRLSAYASLFLLGLPYVRECLGKLRLNASYEIIIKSNGEMRCARKRVTSIVWLVLQVVLEITVEVLVTAERDQGN